MAITLLQFQITGITKLKDLSWKITLNTPELAPQKVAELAALGNAQGFAAFNPVMFTDDEIKSLAEAKVEVDDRSKTHSERLRNVLYALYKYQDPIGVEFSDFYRDSMEKIISHYKAKLPERES